MRGEVRKKPPPSSRFNDHNRLIGIVAWTAVVSHVRQFGPCLSHPRAYFAQPHTTLPISSQTQCVYPRVRRFRM
jgi:hypothetical protein